MKPANTVLQRTIDASSHRSGGRGAADKARGAYGQQALSTRPVARDRVPLGSGLGSGFEHSLDGGGGRGDQADPLGLKSASERVPPRE